MSMIITATDLFAGAGGSSEGLRQAGIRVVTAANHDPIAVATHRANHPDTEHRCADLSETDWRTFPRTQVLWLSPSCVWHARSGGRKRPPADVERMRADAGAIDRATAFAAIEAAEVHRYPIIFVENVPEFQAWTLYRWWLDGLRALGYHVQPMVLDAYDFGEAQHRKRLFLAATFDGLHIDLTPPYVPVRNAAHILDDHPLEPVTRRLYVSPQIDAIAEREVPHLVTYRRNARPHRTDRRPLATITAGGNHHAIAMVDSRGRQWHRLLTDRECARAQGFPDSYEFVGTRTPVPELHGPVRKQIGNAVPVGIARWFGERASEALEAA